MRPKIAYRRGGHGPPVLLIHGVGGDSRSWDRIGESLRPRHDVVAVDLRGHGDSDPITAPLDAQDLARDALQVLDEAGIRSCAVAGFSLGGAVAQALVLEHPERVDRLALIGSVAGRTAEEQTKARERIRFLEEHGLAALVEGNRERWFTDAFRRDHADVVEQRIAQVKACDGPSYLHAFRVFATADFADRLHEIRVPTLVVTGEHDLAATARMARLMGERIRDADVHVLPNLRHSVLIEATATITELLARFLESGARSTGQVPAPSPSAHAR